MSTHLETRSGDVYCPEHKVWSETSDATTMYSADGMEAEGIACLACYNLLEEDEIETVHHRYIGREFFCDGTPTSVITMYRMIWPGEGSPTLCDHCREQVNV
jgi:hypothetical protein